MSNARIQRGGSTWGGFQAPPGINPPSKTAEPIHHIPLVEPALIAHLKSTFPVALSKDADLRDYDRMLGHQELIQHLEELMRAQSGTL